MISWQTTPIFTYVITYVTKAITYVKKVSQNFGVAMCDEVFLPKKS